MECFRQNWRSGPKTLADFSEPLNASLVPRVCRIEQGDEWTGINEDHRPIFRRNTSFTARFASLAGATDQPPVPRSRRR